MELFPHQPRNQYKPLAVWLGLAISVLGLALLAFYQWGQQESLANLLFGARLSLNPIQLAQLAFVKGQVLCMGAVCAGLGLLLCLVGSRVTALFVEGLRSGAPATSYPRLFWASFLSLFFEIIFIRWISTEIRIFAFFKNVPLIAAYLGLGIGCLVSGRPRRLELVFLPGLSLFLGLVGFGSDTFLRVISFAGATLGTSDQLIWGHTFSASWRVLAGILFYAGVAALFVTQVALFIPLGHLVGRGFSGLPRLAAYSTNILGVIMVEILLANLVVAKFRIGRTGGAYGLLLASLLASYFFNPSGAASRDFLAGQLWPTLVLLLPLFFAGIVFAVVFAKASRVESAFGWNLMGGVLGGFLEYSSLVFGFRFLTLLAVATYGLSWLIQARSRRLA